MGRRSYRHLFLVLTAILMVGLSGGVVVITNCQIAVICTDEGSSGTGGGGNYNQSYQSDGLGDSDEPCPIP